MLSRLEALSTSWASETPLLSGVEASSTPTEKAPEDAKFFSLFTCCGLVLLPHTQALESELWHQISPAATAMAEAVFSLCHRSSKFLQNILSQALGDHVSFRVKISLSC